MKLSDIMSHMNLATYPTVALVLFLGVFVLIAVRVMRAAGAEMDRCGRLPLDEDGPAAGG
jgi:hypothetical protein